MGNFRYLFYVNLKQQSNLKQAKYVQIHVGVHENSAPESQL